jgi:Lipocalin-like domain
MMNRLSTLVTITVLFAGVALFGSNAVAQQKSLKEQVVGTWTHVSTKYKFPDGKTTDTFGPNAKGMLMLDAAGHVVFVNMRSDLPKFASKDRTKGTPEENKAVVAGSFAYFGTYTVNEAERTFTVHYEGTTFPNFDAIDAKRTITTLTADELKYENSVATIGPGVVVEAVWKRAK